MFARLGNNVSLGRSLTGLQYHHRLDGLAPGIVGNAKYSRLQHGWVLVDRSNHDLKQKGVFLLLVSGERRIKRVGRCI